eukprot:12830812-Alexandrium_andersonii.AAC.1
MLAPCLGWPPLHGCHAPLMVGAVAPAPGPGPDGGRRAAGRGGGPRDGSFGRPLGVAGRARAAG